MNRCPHFGRYRTIFIPVYRIDVIEQTELRVRGILQNFPMKDRKLYIAGYSTTGPDLGHTSIPIFEKPNEDDPPKFITEFYSTKIVEEWSSWEDEILTIQAQFWNPRSLRYSILGTSPFQINSTTGKLYLIESVDREITSKLTVNIEARTKFSTTVAKMVLEVLVMDINDNEPVFRKNPRNIIIPEMNTNNRQMSIHQDLFDFEATDDDIDLNGMIRYNLVNCPSALSIDHYTGKFRILKMAAKLLQAPLYCQIMALDLGTIVQLKSTINVTVMPNPTFSLTNLIDWRRNTTCKLFSYLNPKCSYIDII